MTVITFLLGFFAGAAITAIGMLSVVAKCQSEIDRLENEIFELEEKTWGRYDEV